MSVVTREEQATLGRLPGLISRFAEVLSDFEAELVREAIDRFRRRGAKMTLTSNERFVLSDAVGAMDKAKATAEAEDAENDRDAAASMKGAA